MGVGEGVVTPDVDGRSCGKLREGTCTCGPVVCGVRLRGAEATGHVSARCSGVKCVEEYIRWVLYPPRRRFTYA
jgi:hypothetical protein